MNEVYVQACRQLHPHPDGNTIIFHATDWQALPVPLDRQCCVEVISIPLDLHPLGQDLLHSFWFIENWEFANVKHVVMIVNRLISLTNLPNVFSSQVNSVQMHYIGDHVQTNFYRTFNRPRR